MATVETLAFEIERRLEKLPKAAEAEARAMVLKLLMPPGQHDGAVATRPGEPTPKTTTRSRKRRRARGEEMTKWTANPRARRVPTFVIEATGLKTKKEIVAKFGEGEVFEKGKPLPPQVTLPKAAAKAAGAKRAARAEQAAATA